MRPGYKTTEFYVTLATLIGNLVAATSGSLPPEWAAGISGGLAVAYAIARAVVKVGDTLSNGGN